MPKLVAETFKVGEEEYVLSFYDSRLSVDVKYRHEDPKLSRVYQYKYDKLRQVGLLRETSFYADVRQAVNDSWWEEIKRCVQDILPMVDIYSAGTSGGYLTLARVTMDHIESLAHMANSECTHCQEPYSGHANQKCLYFFTSWQPMDGLALRRLKQYRAITQAVTRAVSQTIMHELILEEAQAYIDHRWEQHRLERTT